MSLSEIPGERLDGADVLIVGAGLIGASVGLALAASGVRTWLLDSDPGAESVAVRLGAGNSWPGERPGPAADHRGRDHTGEPAGSGQHAVGVDGPLPPHLVPRHVVAAVPPAHVGAVVAWASRTYLHATISDVSSVKTSPAAEAETAGADMTRYVGGHPVAGRETSGAGGARADLFVDRPWAVCPGPRSASQALDDAREVALRCRARVVQVSPQDHDRVLARLSHVPQLVASALASAIDAVGPGELSLVGQGFRDTTRVADSDAALWGGIVSANAGPVAAGLRAVAERLLDVAAVLEGGLTPADTEPGNGAWDEETSAVAAARPESSAAGDRAVRYNSTAGAGDRAAADRAAADGAAADGAAADRAAADRAAADRAAAVGRLVAAGRTQRGRLPGKPAGRPTSRVTLVLPDAPGELVRVLSVAAAADVNVEDLRLEHSPAREAGVMELLVPVGRADDLVAALRAEGWSAHRVE